VKLLEANLEVQSRTIANLSIERRKRERARTSQQKAEQALFESQKMEAIGRLAGGIAHDQNNHLLVIMANADMMTSGYILPEEVDQILSDIARTAADSAQLTRQLLALGKAEVMTKGRSNPNQVLQARRKMFQRVLSDDMALTLDLGEADTVDMHEAQLGQILLNLVINARDAMPQGGRLKISSSTVPAQQLSWAAGEIAEFVAIEVQDTGIGMDEDTCSHIFEPFFSTKGAQGTGLGLSSAYGLVTQVGGRIEVKSAPGEGTTFMVYLPVPVVKETEEGRARTPRQLQTTIRGTILLADDDENVRQIIKRTLSQAGYQVLDAPNAERALEMARRHKGNIDLLCTDGIMPGRGSIYLVKSFQDLHPDSVLLVCSGHLEADLLRRGIRTGQYAFLGKPFTGRELLAKVDELIH
jgi:signal transduction histidine kinase